MAPSDIHRYALSPGHRVLWYEIVRVLGQGGFGITYLALDTNLEQQVAIKEYLPADVALREPDGRLTPRTASEGELYQWGLHRFLSEARTLSRFDHPNIVRVYSVFEASETAYMVMRYEHGEPLNDILERRKRLPQDELLKMVLPILAGLEQVHAAGFVHRDVQPANIYIRHDGSPVLLDFGAARESHGKQRTLTILVAPGYAPFEQYYSSSQEQGPWTDIYGLGATLYRAVAGVAPIDAIERSRGILGSTRDMLVPAVVAGQGRYSESFLRAIDHALRFNERDRPQTSAAWAAELRADVRDSVPAAGPDPSPGEPSLVSTRTNAPGAAAPSRPAWLWPAVATAVFALGIGAGAQLFRPVPVAGTTVPPVATAVRSPVNPVADTSGTESGAVPAPESATNVSPDESRTTGAAASDTPETLAARIAQLETRLAERESQVSLDAQTVAASAADAQRRDDLREETRLQTERLAALRLELANVQAQRDAEQRRLLELSAARGPAEPVTAASATVSSVPEGKAGGDADEPVATDLAARLESAIDAYQRRDYRTALALFRPLADQDEPVAQFHLGRMYREGLGVPATNATAIPLLLKSANHGNRDAQLELAGAYLAGTDGQGDPFMAYAWFLVAQRNGATVPADARDTARNLLQTEQQEHAATLAGYLQSARNDTR